MSVKGYMSFMLYFLLVFLLFFGGVSRAFHPYGFYEPGLSFIARVHRRAGEFLRSAQILLADRRAVLEELRRTEEERLIFERRFREQQLKVVDNLQLQKSLQLPPAPSGRLLPVRTIGGNLSGLERTVRIDGGEAQGFKPGAPLLEFVGDTWVLRGKIQRVFSGHSLVILTDDPRFTIGARLDGVADREFVLEGHGYRKLVIDNFPEVLEATPGDRVYVARASLIAPAGVVIGSVTGRGGTEQQVVSGKRLFVSPPPYASFPELGWVLIRDD